MQKIFQEVGSLDKRCYEKFNLTEDILMENASIAMKDFICKNFKLHSKILIVSGVGNNGADGIVLARLLHKDFKISLFVPFGAKSPMAKLQLNRVQLIGLKLVTKIKKKYDIVVDSLFGSGLNKPLNDTSEKLITKLNLIKAYKLSCDIPSGILNNGTILSEAFKADTTITMGALKLSLFNDEVKDFVGKIVVANLGVAREVYETLTDVFLLKKSDMKLPIRTKLNSHKGVYGHTNIICGDKKGAGVISALSATAFGSGLTTIISKQNIEIPFELMQSNKLSKNVGSIAVGMGLGESLSKKELKKLLLNKTPKVCDADIFYKKIILKVLKQKNIVLTPHPKEFVALLKLTKLADITVAKLQKNRFEYALKFSKKYPNVVLLLKGANVIIAKNKNLYINSFGSNTLSKGGSGDVLTGLIASLLAQNHPPLLATFTASLAHSIASEKYKNNNYSMTPNDLIKKIKKL